MSGNRVTVPMPLDEDLRQVYEANASFPFAQLVMQCQLVRELKGLRAELAKGAGGQTAAMPAPPLVAETPAETKP